ncbi:DUF2956 domain-containing protein [Methylomagnum sp.]
MTKPTEKPAPAPSAEELLLDEAMRMARAVQKPGQTKEQTKLVAQGIAKGIELYKKQQSAKARERDKARKRAQRLKQTAADTVADQGTDEADWPGETQDTGGAGALLVGGILFAAMALAHLARVWAGWNLVLGPWTIPSWLSVMAAALLVGLAAWLLYNYKPATQR